MSSLPARTSSPGSNDSECTAPMLLEQLHVSAIPAVRLQHFISYPPAQPAPTLHYTPPHTPRSCACACALLTPHTPHTRLWSCAVPVPRSQSSTKTARRPATAVRRCARLSSPTRGCRSVWCRSCLPARTCTPRVLTGPRGASAAGSQRPCWSSARCAVASCIAVYSYFYSS